MRWVEHARVLVLLPVVALGVFAPGLAGLARPRPPAPIEAPPPPEPAGPVGLPDRMIQDAAAYDSYMREAVAISPAFIDAASVSKALSLARAYAPKSLIRGAVAYGAIAALEDQNFIAALRAAGNSPEHRGQMVDYIIANPAYLYGFAGYDVAAALAREALGPTALRLYRTGLDVRQAAYDIQKQGWSKLEVTDLKGRLAAAEAAADKDMEPEPERLADARQAINGPAPLPTVAEPLAPPYTPIIAHALQLAAIAALGEARNDTYERVAVLTTDHDTIDCLGVAKRNFHECLAVAKPNYEDIFCTGQHGLSDTGACMVKASGLELPVPPPPPPAPPAKKKTSHRRRTA